MQYNLFDPKPIDRFLEDVAPDQPKVQALLKLALAKPLAKRPENLEPVNELASDAPDWLKAKWPEGGPYHRFRPDAELTGKVRHVADWLKVAFQDQEPWLAQLSHGRPTRFTSINTLGDALAMADADMREKNKKLAKQLPVTAEGEETVMDLGSGFRMVRLTTPTALDRESVAMGHCIGQGAYDEHLQTGDRQFFSLRDAKNLPHATIEVNTESKAVLECQGKENKPPVAKYLPHLQRFITEEHYSLEAPASHTGLIEQCGQYYSIFALPENLTVDYLNLMNTGITSLPKGLNVLGGLNLSNTRISSLPEGLKVGAGLDLSGTPIMALPEGLEVGGGLYLQNTLISRLPKGLKVGGDLYLNGTLITELPEDLVVRGRIIPNDKLHIRQSSGEVRPQQGSFQGRARGEQKPGDAGPSPP